jgi:hypothetical protein
MRSIAAVFGGLGVLGAAVLGLGIAGASDARAEGDGGVWSGPIAQVECGKPGQPACPLQAWMRANVATPLASNDTESLAKGLDKAANLSPDPGWVAWPQLASAGAAAARKGDLAGTRASCKGCHDAFRDVYREKYRNRPIPR